MKKTGASASFAGCELGQVGHACAFFNGDDEAFGVSAAEQKKYCAKAKKPS
ncbi:hypothetical protein [Mesorhizobium kowhaii]|uniref:hypothetical protein n=1 Tax=Mesorhizobium kowhaii TaxID=1300272 RepID=UPI00142D8F4F|nr:hypothetical protein [Mesorhizobium kowhaii]